MTKVLRIEAPFGEELARSLRIGQRVLLSGTIFTARDGAHKRLVEALAKGRAPLDLADQVIYYAGPAPARPGKVIGPVGPTTSGRMDPYTVALLDAGLRAMIGKGLRSPEVLRAMAAHGAVYFGATGGAAALLARSVRRCDVVAYEDLGPEAIRRLEVVEMPLVVVADAQGGDLYREGPEAFLGHR